MSKNCPDCKRRGQILWFWADMFLRIVSRAGIDTRTILGLFIIEAGLSPDDGRGAVKAAKDLADRFNLPLPHYLDLAVFILLLGHSRLQVSSQTEEASEDFLQFLEDCVKTYDVGKVNVREMLRTQVDHSDGTHVVASKLVPKAAKALDQVIQDSLGQDWQGNPKWDRDARDRAVAQHLENVAQHLQDVEEGKAELDPSKLEPPSTCRHDPSPQPEGRPRLRVLEGFGGPKIKKDKIN